MERVYSAYFNSDKIKRLLSESKESGDRITLNNVSIRKEIKAAVHAGLRGNRHIHY